MTILSDFSELHVPEARVELINDMVPFVYLHVLSTHIGTV